ncbi:unnamed protein product [Angiostrongylus costaricensis]|uniref:NSP4 n=1 Tax=Angiostrongylus costaricensis TaxID=334426 RepID=A0A0R3PA90_ANGCS|nr:unnamed protein product [Angiostrongylus costaricensis]
MTGNLNFRSPYVTPKRNYWNYYDDHSDYYRDFKSQSRDYDQRLRTYERTIYFIRVMAYMQIFIAGVLLVSDVSRIILLWTFLQSFSTVIEMVKQLAGFNQTYLELVVQQGRTEKMRHIAVEMKKMKSALTSAIDAVEVARAADRTLMKEVSLDITMGMIRSKTHHKLLRLLSAIGPKWPLGIQARKFLGILKFEHL